MDDALIDRLAAEAGSAVRERLKSLDLMDERDRTLRVVAAMVGVEVPPWEWGKASGFKKIEDGVRALCGQEAIIAANNNANTAGAALSQIEEVVLDRAVTNLAKAVFVVLARSAGRPISFADVAVAIGASRREVTRSIGALQDAGYIQITRRGDQTTPSSYRAVPSGERARVLLERRALVNDSETALDPH